MTHRARQQRASIIALGLAMSVAGSACDRASQTSDLLGAVACADGDQDACKRSFDANAKRCEDGNGHACILHGLEHKNQRVVPKDEGKATALFERACSLGEADGCWYASTQYAQGRGAAKDTTRAAELAETGCTKGSINGCYALAVAYEFGRGRTQDRSKAQAFYAKACTLSKRDNGSGCSQAQRLATQQSH